MRFRLLAGVSLVLCASAPGLMAQQQFSVFTRLADSSGAPVTKVGPENFRVLEDGVQAKVLKAEKVDWPLKLQVLIDSGTGLRPENLGVLRQSLRTLIEAVPENSEVALVVTAPQPRFLVRFTKDRQALLQAVDRLSPEGATGRFVESLREALDRVDRDREDNVPVVVTIGTTFGDNAPNPRDVNELSALLGKLRHVKVHVVLMAAPGFSGGSGTNQVDMGISAAKVTGGRYEFINSATALEKVLVGLAAEIKKSYGTSSGFYRLMVERPPGKTGNLGKVGVASLGSLIASDVVVEMR